MSKQAPETNFENIFNPKIIIIDSIIGAGIGAVYGGISGSVGKFACSFFNPAIASTAGTFLTFAGVGAIAVPLMLIQVKIKEELLNNSAFLDDKPKLKAAFSIVLSDLIMMASLAAAAAMLGTPLGTTLLCMGILPLAIDTLTLLYTGLSECLNAAAPARESELYFA